MELLTYIVSLLGMSIVLGVGSSLMALLAAYICGKRDVSLFGWTITGAWIIVLAVAANSIVMTW